jgi:hypothetical protein
MHIDRMSALAAAATHDFPFTNTAREEPMAAPAEYLCIACYKNKIRKGRDARLPLDAGGNGAGYGGCGAANNETKFRLDETHDCVKTRTIE